MKKDVLNKLNNAVKNNWNNKTFYQIPSHRITTVTGTSSNTSTDPYDIYAQQFLNDAESEIKDDYRSRQHTRIGLLIGLTLYFIFLGGVIFWALSHKNDLALKIILASGLFSSVIGLLIIVFRYAFNSSDKYYKFIEDIMDWANKEHKYDK